MSWGNFSDSVVSSLVSALVYLTDHGIVTWCQEKDAPLVFSCDYNDGKFTIGVYNDTGMALAVSRDGRWIVFEGELAQIVTLWQVVLDATGSKPDSALDLIEEAVAHYQRMFGDEMTRSILAP